MRKDAVLLEEITDQELDNVNGAGFCENMKGRVEGSEWPPAGLLETFGTTVSASSIENSIFRVM